MQEQSFEKSVKQAMEPFSITPSDGVWQGVSVAIKPERKKRRLAPWLLLLAGLGGAGFWVIKDINNQEIIAKETSAATVDKPSSNESDKVTEPTIQTPVITDSQNISQPSTKDKSGKQSLSTQSSSTNSSEKQGGVKTNLVKSKSDAKNSITTSGASVLVEGNNEIFKENFEAEKVINASNIAESIAQKRFRSLERIGDKSSLFPPKPESIIQGLSQSDSQFALQGKLVSTVKHKPKSHFSFGIQAGVAGLQQQQTPLVAAMNRAFDNISAPLTNAVQSFGNNSLTGLSTPKSGLHIAVDAYWNKPIFNRTTFVSGLQYSLYTQRQAIGARLKQDSILLAPESDASESKTLFTPGTATDFVNNYHLITLPLMLQWQPVRYIPLRLEGCLAVGYLFAAKSLQYDAVSRVYYQSESSLRKLQMMFIGGADYRIAKTKQHLFYIGPKMTYHFTKLHRNGSVNNGQLFQYGVGLTLAPK